MIPTPQRIRSTRQWSAAMAAAVAIVVPVVAYGVTRRPDATCIAFAAAFAAGAAMHWARSRALRRRLKALRRPFPSEWERILTDRVAFFAGLGPLDRDRFRQLVTIFLDETPVQGVGCEIDEDIRVLVAASAVIPIFALPDWEYGMLHEVVVRDGTFIITDKQRGKNSGELAGMVEDTGGQFHGTLVLSRPDLESGFDRTGEIYNVGIHEFAHLVDEGDGRIDGVPASLPPEFHGPWQRLVQREMERGEHGPSDIPQYAFTNEREFFAVLAEYFFQAPDELGANHPELYAMLRRIFRQDPRAGQGRFVPGAPRRPGREPRGGKGRDGRWG